MSIERQKLKIEPLGGYTSEIGRMSWMLEDARHRTLHILDGITQAALDWLPPDGDNTIGTLLYHIAAIEASWIYEDTLQRWDEKLDALVPYDVRDERGILSAAKDVSLEAHLERLTGMRELTLQAFRDMTIEDFQRPRRMPDYYVTPEWVLHHLMQHEAEHRGQISDLRIRAERTLNNG